MKHTSFKRYFAVPTEEPIKHWIPADEVKGVEVGGAVVVLAVVESCLVGTALQEQDSKHLDSRGQNRKQFYWWMHKTQIPILSYLNQTIGF